MPRGFDQWKTAAPEDDAPDLIDLIDGMELRWTRLLSGLNDAPADGVPDVAANVAAFVELATETVELFDLIKSELETL